VKTANGQSFVSVFDPALPDTGGTQGVVSKTPPTMIPVEVGISDDTVTEIISGLTEGQQVVARTITPGSAAQSASQAPSLFGGGGVRTGAAGGVGGGNVRIQAR
jgi:hypothetical protein